MEVDATGHDTAAPGTAVVPGVGQLTTAVPPAVPLDDLKGADPTAFEAKARELRGLWDAGSALVVPLVEDVLDILSARARAPLDGSFAAGEEALLNTLTDMVSKSIDGAKLCHVCHTACLPSRVDLLARSHLDDDHATRVIR